MLSCSSLIHYNYSVGGADYGSVRIGAFMGRKLIKSMASEQLNLDILKCDPKKVGCLNNDEKDEDGMDIFEAEAAMDYLCNISPHRLFLLSTFDTSIMFFLYC